MLWGLFKTNESLETTIVDFGNKRHKKHLLEGWSSKEKWPDGTTVIWSSGKVSKLEIFVSEIADKEVQLRCLPFDYSGAPKQTINVSINDKFLTTIELEKDRIGWKGYEFTIPAPDVEVGKNILTFEYGYVKTPAEVFKGNTDTRPLAVAFDFMKVESPQPRSSLSTQKNFGVG